MTKPIDQEWSRQQIANCWLLLTDDSTLTVNMGVLRDFVAARDAPDARRAALEEAAKVCEDYTREHRESYEGRSHNHCEDFGCGDISRLAIDIRALLDAAPNVPASSQDGPDLGRPRCACTITRHERQENSACPVHFPARAR